MASSLGNLKNALIRSLQNTLNNIVANTSNLLANVAATAGYNPPQPGGYFGPNSAYSRGGMGEVLSTLSSHIVNPLFGGTGKTYYASGEVDPGSFFTPGVHAANIGGQFSGTNITPPPPTPSPGGYLGSSSAYSRGGIGSFFPVVGAANIGDTITSPSPAVSPGALSFTAPSAGRGLGLGVGTGIGLSGRAAPVGGINTPPAKTSVGGGTGAGYGAGYSSGAVGISGFPAPTAEINLPPPPTSINNTKPIGQFEAMIRALQKLNPQSGYIQTPLGGGFGPGYGMGGALRRIREYQTMYRR